MPDVLFIREGEPSLVPSQLAHPRTPRHGVGADEAFCVLRVPPPSLGDERDLRGAHEVDGAPLYSGARGIPWGANGERNWWYRDFPADRKAAAQSVISCRLAKGYRLGRL